MYVYVEDASQDDLETAVRRALAKSGHMWSL